MSKKIMERKKNGTAMFALGFILHFMGLLFFLESFFGLVSGEFFWTWDLARILDVLGTSLSALFVMFVIAFPIIMAWGGLCLSGLIPLYKSSRNNLVWFNPVKKKLYYTETYKGINWEIFNQE